MKRTKADRGEGLGRKVEIVMGYYRPPGHKIPSLLRSEEHRRRVAKMKCANCGRNGPCQVAHANITKGMGLKACDSLVFPLCPACHRHHDQGGIPKEERWRREWVYLDGVRADLMKAAQWSPELELHFRNAIEPLCRLVNGDAEKEKAAGKSGLGTALMEKF
ncbi:Uncharacterised protein [Bordetella avium]|nr:Uncharacterised protein [Bordetella avium]